MTLTRHGSSVIEYPNELEIVTTREFDAPIALVPEAFAPAPWFGPVLFIAVIAWLYWWMLTRSAAAR